MKRLVFILLILLAGINIASSQQLVKNSGILSVGIGLVPGIGANVSYDYGLVDTWGPGIFTIGGFVGLNSWNNSYRYEDHPRARYRETMLAFAPKVTYRYAFENDPFEVYVTAMLGVALYSYSRYYTSALSLFGGASVGGRYFIDSKFSVFAEIGYTTSVITAGICFTL